MSPALLLRLNDVLTTQGGHRGVDPATASPLVVQAIADSQSVAKGYLDRRSNGGGRFAPLASPHASPVVGAGFEVQAETRTSAGGRLARVMVVKPGFANGQQGGLRVIDWRTARRL